MESNNAFEKKYDGGYDLPAGCTWNPKIINNKKEGLVEVVNEDGMLVAELEFKEDRLNGLCKFYKRGKLERKSMYENDIVNGRVCMYEDGEKTEDCYYENGEKKSKLKITEEKEGYYDEVDLKSEKIKSICSYNEKHERVGKGYIFDNGVIDKIVMYENGGESRCIKKFNVNEMIEFDEKGNKVYSGGYLNSFENDYPREGNGKEYFCDTLIYEGEWKNGKREGKGISYKHRIASYDGMWKDNLPEGKGKLYKNGEVICKGDKWIRGRLEMVNGEYIEYEEYEKEINKMISDLKVVVRRKKDWSTLNNEVTELLISQDVCKKMKSDLVIDGYHKLKSILVKNNSMKNLNSLKICNCEMLEKFETEDGCSSWHKEYSQRGAFEFVKSVELSSTIELIHLTRSS